MPVYVGDLLTASPATTAGIPTPSRTWQWLRNGTAISGATSSTYTTVSDDLGASLAVQQTETNFLGAASSTSAPVGPVELDPDAAAYITAVEAADTQALEAGVKTAINDFVVGCKADGIWAAIKASCILAGARTLNGALVPLKGTAPTNFNFVSGDYNRKTGLVGDEATKYLNSNRNNNADPQNSHHQAVYVTVIASSLGTLIGCDAPSGIGSSSITLQPLTTGAPFRSRLTNFNNSRGTRVTSTETGFMGMSRSLAASFVSRISGSNETISDTSSSPADALNGVFARPTTTGSVSSYTNPRMSFYSIGESLDLAQLDTRVSALMTAIDGAI
jgi:hypothetical protein